MKRTSRLLLSLVWLAMVPRGLRASDTSIDAAAPGLNEAGVPSFTLYGSESLGIQGPPVDLLEMPDGRLLVAGATDLAFGDGTRWDTVPRALTETAGLNGRLSVDADGKLYTSLAEGFAQIGFEPNGRWHIAALTPISDDSTQVWPAFATNVREHDHTYWFGNALVLWDPGSHQEPRVILPRVNIRHLFSLGDDLYVSNSNDGGLLKVAANGKHKAFKASGTNNGNYSITCSSLLDEKRVLLGTTNRGLQIFDGNTLVPLVSSGLLSGGNVVSDLCATRGGYFAAAIHSFGVVFFDKEGHILQTLDRHIDYRFAQVRRLCLGSDGGLWGLFDQGLIRIDFPSRLSQFEPLINAATDHVAPVRHQGRLWLVATGTVLQGQYEEDGRLTGFAKNSPDADFVYTLADLDGHLLAGTERGIFSWENGHWNLLVPNIRNARFCLKSPVDGRWLYAAHDQVGWMELRTPEPKITSFPHKGMGDIYFAAVDDKGRVWLELGPSKLACIDSTKPDADTRLFGPAQGVPGGWAEIFVVDGKIRFNSSGRHYLFDEKRDAFITDQDLPERYPELNIAVVGRPTRDALGRLWVLNTDATRIITDESPGKARQIEILPGEHKPNNFITSPDGCVWLQERLHFARYDARMPAAPEKTARARITRLELPVSNRVLLAPPDKLPFHLEHGDNTLIAHVLAVGLPFGEHAILEMKVEGLDNNWIPLDVSGSAPLNRLRDGNYTLRVRPRLTDGYGEEGSLQFVILPPWYRTRLAYLFFSLGGIGLLSSAILLPVYIGRRHKRHLEALVARRTQELSASQERYRLLNIDLEARVAQRTSELAARVTEVERLNADLDHSATKLTEANSELESFSYSVSHDLRAPLRNITGFLEILRRKLQSGDHSSSSHYLGIIEAETKRMGTLIEDLLAFSRIARADLRSEVVSLAQVVAEARHSLAPECEGRDIEWRVADLGRVRGDKNLLTQVMINLLGNAVKFSSKRPKALIEVGLLGAPDQDGMQVYFVRDNGAGFNPRYEDKLFGVFQRLHSNKEFEGTGIGLANVKRIISRHQGKIWAEGKVDVGAVFYFTLPTYPKES